MKIKNLICAVIAIVMLFSLTGCTLLGFIAGAKIDADQAIVPPNSIHKQKRIKSDMPVRVHLRDNRIFEGTFLFMEKTDSSAYNRRYEVFRNSSAARRWFPALNDTLVVSRLLGYTTTTDPCHYLFKGFDLNAIRLQSLPDKKVWSKNLDSLSSISYRRGYTINARTLQTYVLAGGVPLQSELLLQTHKGVERIPVEEIRQINLPKPVTGRVALTLLGMTLDILALREGIWEMNESLSRGLNDL
jgi:hypothetical protein